MKANWHAASNALLLLLGVKYAIKNAPHKQHFQVVKVTHAKKRRSLHSNSGFYV